MKGHYSIQLASKLSGVGVHTIRAWEKRYQAITPERNSSGRREYNDQNIEKLTLLNDLCTLGHSIGKIAKLETNELKVLLAKLGRQVSKPEEQENNLINAKSVVQIGESLKNLMLALEAYKLDIVNHELNKLKLVLNPRELALDIISPLLREVGIQVALRKYSISQEHALSALLKFHIGHILFKTSHSKSTKPYKIIICAPEGDYHEFGILNAALLCTYYNIPYIYLGPNLPVDSLIDAYRSLEANIMLVGSTIIPETKSSNFIDKYFDLALRSLGDGQLIVGGPEHTDYTKLRKSKKANFIESMEALDTYLKSL